MMQQKVILHSVQLNRKGEIKYFQIPLQGRAIKIIGVEASAFLFSDVVQQTPTPDPAPTPDPNPPAPVPVNNNCPNPGTASIDPVSDNVANNIRTQIFKIGAAVNPDFIYSCGVYSVVISVTAVGDDTPTSIASKMANEVNATSLATWNQYGSNNRNYKPTANANSDSLTLTTDLQHSFFASGSGSCQAAPPPPPPPPPSQLLQYDPLFTIVQNERAGTLSLQSPDVTDIFLQCEAWRDDKNINYGDFSYPGMMPGEWVKGRKRIATDVSLTTASPILEAYYKDSWGLYYGKDISYGLNILVWYEKILSHDK